MASATLNTAASSATVAKPTDWPVVYVLHIGDPQPPAGYLAQNNVLGCTWALPHAFMLNAVPQPNDLIGVAVACKTGQPYTIQSSDQVGRVFQAEQAGLPVVFDTEAAEGVYPTPVWSAQTVPEVQLFTQNLQSIGNMIPFGFVHWRYGFEAGNFTWQERDLTTGFNSAIVVQQWQAIKPIAQYANYWCPAIYSSDTAYMATICDWYKGLSQPVCYPNSEPQAIGPPVMPLVWGGVLEGASPSAFAGMAQTLVQHADGVVVWGGWTDSGALLQAIVAARPSGYALQTGGGVVTTNILTTIPITPAPTAIRHKATTRPKPIHTAETVKGSMPLGLSAPLILATLAVVVWRWRAKYRGAPRAQ